MFIFENFLHAIAEILRILLDLYGWIILFYVIVSWLKPSPHNEIIRSIIHFLHLVTEPVLTRIRRIIPPMGLDFSPFIVYLMIIFLQIFLVTSLHKLADNIGNLGKPKIENSTYSIHHESSPNEYKQTNDLF